jgi:heme exporter protein A
MSFFMMITASNLSCVRGSRQILQNVNFVAEAHDCLILRGPNGAGKTTLLRVLAGLSDPDSGTLEITFDDVIFSGHLDAVKLQLTVVENLQFWAGVYGVEHISEILNRFDLTQFTARPAANLSAGQKRRLGLARLTLSKRKIWLMDEPTTSLDIEHTRLIADSIQEHCTAGGIAILSTHLDLDIDGAKTLDITQFAPKDDTNTSPFLEGTF